MSTATLDRTFLDLVHSAMKESAAVREKAPLENRSLSAVSVVIVQLSMLKDTAELIKDFDDLFELVQTPDVAASLEHGEDADVAKVASSFGKSAKNLSALVSRTPMPGTVMGWLFARRIGRLREIERQLLAYEEVLSVPRPARVVLSGEQQRKLAQALMEEQGGNAVTPTARR